MRYSDEERVQIFHDTLKKSEALPEQGKEEAVYYDWETMVQMVANHSCVELTARSTPITVSGDDSYLAARKLKEQNPDDDVLVLNFANATSRGGGVAHGASAQEEDLCRTSTLYLSLASDAATAFYQFNKENQLHYMGSDTAIYSPNVYIIKDNEYQDISPVKVSVITMAAPVNPEEFNVIQEYDAMSVMEERIFKMLCLAEETGIKRLVLGAWGCGAFGNVPLDVAHSFKTNLEQFDCFEEVVFAVLQAQGRDSYNYQCFKEVFGGGGRG